MAYSFSIELGVWFLYEHCVLCFFGSLFGRRLFTRSSLVNVHVFYFFGKEKLSVKSKKPHFSIGERRVESTAHEFDDGRLLRTTESEGEPMARAARGVEV